MYVYKNEREKMFTDDGQRKFLRARDKVQALIKESGAVTMGSVMFEGDSFFAMAIIDRMVELGELIEIAQPPGTFAQHRVFVDGRSL